MNDHLNTQKKTVKLAKMGMLVAISVVLVTFIHIPIFPAVSFLEYDPADIPILMGTFAFGPGAGIALTIVTSVIQGTTVSAQSGAYGIIMHIIATSCLVGVAGLVYGRGKSRRRAAIGLLLGSITMVVAMFFANLVVTPLFTGLPRAVIMDLMPMIIAFNVVKAGINSFVTFILYKRLSGFLKR